MDKSFINLTTDEMISRIDIDSRLVPSFKRVMFKIQKYFNEKGYTKERNYAEFFEKYLLDNKFSIKVVDDIGIPNAGGVYYRHYNMICIPKHDVEHQHSIDYYLDGLFCHEFIHFLAMHELNKEMTDYLSDDAKFINEAYTELLKIDVMNSGTGSYMPQCEMIKFLNTLLGISDGYSSFLKGKHISLYKNAIGHASGSYDQMLWNNFLSASKRYHYKGYNENISGSIKDIECAKNDKDYIAAQRAIIEFLIPMTKKDLMYSDIYMERIANVAVKRIAPDESYWSNYVRVYCNSLIKKMGLSPAFLNIMKELLIELAKLKKYDDMDVYTFVIKGREFAVTPDGTLINSSGVVKSLKDGILTVSYQMENVSIDLSKIDFMVRKKEIEKKINKYKKCFEPLIQDDLKMLSKIVGKKGLINLKKYTLPTMDKYKKNKSYVVYVAEFEDRLEVLNDCEILGEINDLSLSEYKWTVITGNNEGLIYSDDIEVINNGIVFTELNSTRLNYECRRLLESELRSRLSEEMLNEIIGEYKKYFEDEEESNLEDNAIDWYVKNKLKGMDDVDKTRLINKSALSNRRFVVSKGNNGVKVSLLDGDISMRSYISSEKCLISTNGDGLYNELYSELSKKSVQLGNDDVKVIVVDSDGKINEGQYVNHRLMVLQNMYNDICLELENIVANENNPDVIMQKLEFLIQKRDLILVAIDENLGNSKIKR